MSKCCLGISLLIFCVACQMKPDKALVDSIIYNGSIQTVDDSLTVVEAMAIQGGVIIDVGSTGEIQTKYSATESINLKGKNAYPGLIDPHCHFYGYGMSMRNADLRGTLKWEDVLDVVINHDNANPSEWVLGRGWDQNDWEDKTYPTNEQLNALFPSRPAVLTRIDGHAVVANSAALDVAGFSSLTEIEGGELLQINGELTGVLIDNAADSLKALIPEPTYDEQIRGILSAQENCFAVGLTSIGDAGLKWKIINLIDELHQHGELKMRVYAMIESATEDLDTILPKGPLMTGRLSARSVKIYADGALGSRGALLLEDYTDRMNHKGLLLHPAEELSYIMELSAKHGFQVCTHGIGDGAIRTVLQLYKPYLQLENDLRWRIEHAQVVHPDDQKTMAELNVIPSVQPTHATSDMYWAEERLGPTRIRYAYAYKDLLSLNGWIPNGSDFPIESINPIFGFYAAVTRQDQKGWPSEGFQMENALTREEALRAMTIWAAKAQFQENEIGSLEIGKKADLVVLDRDLLQDNESDVYKTVVLLTMINGEFVYENETLTPSL